MDSDNIKNNFLDKRELLEQLMKAHAFELKVAPLSFAQRRLHFIYNLKPDSTAYHIFRILRLKGDLNLSAFKKALNEIVRRHDSLRTKFQNRNGEDIQVVTPFLGINILYLDYPELPIDEREAKVLEFAKEDKTTPFNLSEGPLFRFKFYKITSDNHIFTICLHHIITDGWSMRVFYTELSALYSAYVCNNESPLEELPIQYIEFANRQQEYAGSEKVVKQLAYWKEKLKDPPVVHQLPLDFIRPAEQTFQGEMVNFEIDAALIETLKNVGQEAMSTLFMITLTAYSIIISRCSNANDIILGSPIASRNKKDIESLIGFFVNTLAVRVDVSENITFRELLAQINSTILEASDNQDITFDQIIEVLQPERNLNHNPVIQLIFAYHNLPVIDLNLSGIQAELLLNEEDSTANDLEVHLNYSNNRIDGYFIYNKSLFLRRRIERMAGHFINTLRIISSDINRKVSEIDFLSEEERYYILYDLNTSSEDPLWCRSVCELFEEQVGKTPNNNAVVFNGHGITYRELNERANVLAIMLRMRGVKANSIVGVYLERGADLIIGLVGIIKAGGAYLSIDTNTPVERVIGILKDSKSLCLLVNCESSPIELPDIEKIDIEQIKNSVPIPRNPEPITTPYDLFYVIYTSGTTGTPKGVPIKHLGFLNLINNYTRIFSLDATSKLSQISSVSFDAMCFEVWPCLAGGASLYIIDEVTKYSTEKIKQFIAENGITHAFLPTVYAEELVSEDWPLDVTLRYLLTAGDRLKKFSKPTQPFKFYNLYGPTEDTVWTTYKEVKERPSDDSIQFPSIGKPISNKKLYILDQHNNLLPLGVPGELCICGVGLSGVYINSEELTSKKYISNPFEKREILYKTGDLARWLPDGEVEILGRMDNQVKVNGFRIELEEIEHALVQIAGIKQCCVVVKERKTETGSNRYLAAYYILGSGDDVPSPTAILDRLLQVLPEYMVPSALVPMASFPLTSNDKLNKNALPDPDFSLPTEEYAAPSTEREMEICRIWQEILGLDRVGVTDNFFRIGGDSILSIQVSNRIRQAGFNCLVKDIFECKTVKKLAEHILKKSSELQIASEQGILSGELGLLPIQRWFFEKIDSGVLVQPNHWNQSFLIKVSRLDPKKLEAVIRELISYHDVLRIHFIKEQKSATSSNDVRQVYQQSIKLPELKILDVTKFTETEIQSILTDWQSSFDLERGHLFQIGYIYGYPDGSARIYFSLHHMIVDAVSWRILTEDIKTLYNGRPLPKKGTSYRQWIESVANYTYQHPEEVFYWEKQLNGMPNYPQTSHYSAPSIDFLELDKVLTKLLLQKASKAYHTEINDLLLTCLAYALKDINQNDIQGITLEGHGREDIDTSNDTSRTVGWFTNLFPVKLELQDNLKKSIQFVKESLRNIPNKGIGFGAFATDKKNKYTYNDLPLISFNYLGQFDTQEGDWQIVKEGSGISVHPSNQDQNIISINGMVREGKLGFRIVTRLGQDKTKQLSDSLKTQLTKIIEHCDERFEEIGSSFTPSDFTPVRLSQLLIERLETEARANQNEIANIYLANSLQQGFIHHVLNSTDDDAYRVQLLYDYHQPLDIERYIKAWDKCILRFPILRTAFNWEENIIQIIYKQGKLEYYIHDISYLSTQQERDIAIESIQKEDRKQSFDLTKPTLLRLHIIKQTEDYYTILKSDHHSISDGWSGPILLTCIHLYYQELTENRNSNIKEDTAYLKAQDYISNHKEQVHDYWNKSLSLFDSPNDINSLLSTPIDISNYRKTAKPASNILEISGDVYKALKIYSQKGGITLNVIVQFAWHKLLQVYSNNIQSTVGTIVSGRDLPIEGIEESVGLYMNTLPLIINWGNENTIQTQLQYIQQKISELNTHSFADLAKLQKNGERMFHSLLVFENYPTSKVSKDISKIQIRKVIEKVDYPFSIVAYEYNDNLMIKLQYDGKYLSEDKANQHLGELENIIHQVIKNSNKSHNQISLLNSEDYHRIVYQWNETDREYPRNKTICQLFEEQVEKTPGDIALIYEQQQLTYKELNERSNQLARHIRSKYEERTNQSLLTDTFIALYLARNLEMIIGILAVLKSGAAYVPIDTSYPQERITYILDDTNAELILSQRNLINDDYTQLPQGKVVYIDLSEEFYKQVDRSNLPQQNKPTDLAYVIYTSGTTGKPKGVMVEHHQVSSFAVENNYINYKNAYVVAGISNYAFDGSIFDIFFSLLNGKKLVVVDNNHLLNLSLLDNYLIKFKVDTVFITTALFNSLVQNQSKCLDILKQVLFGGEACNIKIVNRFKKCYDKSTLIHVYGPTENIVYSSYCKLNNYDTENVVPIGTRLSDKKLYILDKAFSPVPIGVIGELYIGGPSLARGYLNRSDLTKERFVPNPFANEVARVNDHMRLYKTGDLVRWLSDGNIEFMGRNDDQVKIRGFRIELGEIEHVLVKIPGIKQSCVLVKERETGTGSNKYLVAYYVLDGSNDMLTQTAILDVLSQMLPEYMMPSVLIAIDSLPLNANGKLDRRSLPDPDFESSLKEYVAPTNEIEAKVCRIWQEILGLNRVGITDNFFRIGGNSILAILVSHRMSIALGCVVKVASVFKYGCIEALLKNVICKQANYKNVELEF